MRIYESPRASAADFPTSDDYTWVLAREADRLQLWHGVEILREGAGLIREARAAKHRAKLRGEREKESHDAADKLAYLEARERWAVDAVNVLRDRLTPIYIDVGAAAGAMDRFEREHGMDKLRDMLKARPEAYGPLVGERIRVRGRMEHQQGGKTRGGRRG
ncbi:MAG TPA: hypothetical protein VF613_26150 [Longimicrobium sp.]|jgi:hypothetical protein